MFLDPTAVRRNMYRLGTADPADPQFNLWLGNSSNLFNKWQMAEAAASQQHPLRPTAESRPWQAGLYKLFEQVDVFFVEVRLDESKPDAPIVRTCVHVNYTQDSAYQDTHQVYGLFPYDPDVWPELSIPHARWYRDDTPRGYGAYYVRDRSNFWGVGDVWYRMHGYGWEERPAPWHKQLTAGENVAQCWDYDQNSLSEAPHQPQVMVTVDPWGPLDRISNVRGSQEIYTRENWVQYPRHSTGRRDKGSRTWYFKGFQGVYSMCNAPYLWNEAAFSYHMTQRLIARTEVPQYRGGMYGEEVMFTVAGDIKFNIIVKSSNSDPDQDPIDALDRFIEEFTNDGLSAEVYIFDSEGRLVAVEDGIDVAQYPSTPGLEITEARYS